MVNVDLMTCGTILKATKLVNCSSLSLRNSLLVVPPSERAVPVGYY